MGDVLSSRARQGRHRRLPVRRGRRARYAVGGLVLAAGAFKVAWLVAGASVDGDPGGGGHSGGGLGAAGALSQPPGEGGRGDGRPGDTGAPMSGGATPGVRPSATSLLPAGTSLPPGDAVTPSSPPGPAGTTAPGLPGTHVPRARSRPPSGSGSTGPRPPTIAPTATPGTSRPARPPASPPSPPSQDGSGSGPGVCVPVIGLCVDLPGFDDGRG